MSTTTYPVEGMSCDHCVHAVTEEISALDGVSEVAVELRASGPSQVTVTSDRPLALASIREAIDEAGYELADA
jgi:copper chaperone